VPQFAAYDDGAETVLARNRAPGLVVPRAEVVRSRYARVAAQIFPGRLVGREEERAELAAFCTGRSDSPHGYVWWRAPAWAGKSALMASLVLDPPERVRVVSFFVTARLAGQSDRAAFLEAVPAQLSELVGQQPPGGLTEHSRLTWFWDLLEQAAQTCAERGERLVLLVDGLDEDRGIGVGDDAHSIAGALPARLPDGVRVVVAGRPNPPVPSDVPPRHPLRDPSIVHSLSPSPAAQGIKEAAERELDELLFGGQVERDLLGLLVAAEGGLSSGDLAELTGLTPGEVDRRLRTAYGRSFSSRESAWRPNGTRVFVLAHEELHNSAVAALGESALACYRKRIHAWADDYRDRGWPAGTPEYLLRGYHQMLRACGEVSRMVACATDRARLDRMLDVSGGDAADRAEQVAHTITNPHEQAKALSHLVGALAEDGRVGRAEQLTRTLTEPSSIAGAMSAIVAHLDQEKARRLLAWALTKSRLDMLLPAIAKVDPSIPLRLADEMQPGPATTSFPGIDRPAG